jgi:hypothetical protein
VPGLINAHAHFEASGEAQIDDRLRADDADAARARLRRKRAQGAHERRHLSARSRQHGKVSRSTRAMRSAGTIAGPTIVAAGRAICMTGGHGWFIGREADGEWDVRKAVREQRATAPIASSSSRRAACSPKARCRASTSSRRRDCAPGSKRRTSTACVRGARDRHQRHQERAARRHRFDRARPPRRRRGDRPAARARHLPRAHARGDPLHRRRPVTRRACPTTSCARPARSPSTPRRTCARARRRRAASPAARTPARPSTTTTPTRTKSS